LPPVFLRFRENTQNKTEHGCQKLNNQREYEESVKNHPMFTETVVNRFSTTGALLKLAQKHRNSEGF